MKKIVEKLLLENYLQHILEYFFQNIIILLEKNKTLMTITDEMSGLKFN